MAARNKLIPIAQARVLQGLENQFEVVWYEYLRLLGQQQPPSPSPFVQFDLDLNSTDEYPYLPIGVTTPAISNNQRLAAIVLVIDGQGSVISAGVKPYLWIPFSCAIQEVTLLGDQSGSITVDIAKCAYSAFDAGGTHPVFPGDSITASDTPAIAASTKYDDSLLTGWTTLINAGDCLAFKTSGIVSLTKCTVTFKVRKT